MVIRTRRPSTIVPTAATMPVLRSPSRGSEAPSAIARAMSGLFAARAAVSRISSSPVIHRASLMSERFGCGDAAGSVTRRAPWFEHPDGAIASAATIRKAPKRFIAAPLLDSRGPSRAVCAEEGVDRTSTIRSMERIGARFGRDRGNRMPAYCLAERGEGRRGEGCGGRGRRRSDDVRFGGWESLCAAELESLAHGDLHRPVEVLGQGRLEVLHAIDASFQGHRILSETRDAQQSDLEP